MCNNSTSIWVLFIRLPRGYELTKLGQELLAEVEAVEKHIHGIDRRRKGRLAHLPIHITAGTWMTWCLSKHVRNIATQDARLVFCAAETCHHIGWREATIGVRNSRLEEATLAARKTTHVVFAPYAASTDPLEDHWIISTAQTLSATWVRTHKGNRIRYEISNLRSLVDLEMQGVGHVGLSCFVGDDEFGLVRSGSIIPALSHDQWLVVHGEDRHQPVVRRTVDLVAQLIVTARGAFEGNHGSMLGKG